jgi:hypothetical protein
MTTRQLRVRGDPNVDSIPWEIGGITAGVVGGATVAVFFLVLDVLAGRPLWTPYWLGSSFILGREPAAGSAINLVLVAGYTVIHGAVFVTVGMLAAFELMTGTRLPGRSRGTRAMLLAFLLFVGFEVLFLGVASVIAPNALAVLGGLRLSLANALAAAAMAGYLRHRAPATT